MRPSLHWFDLRPLTRDERLGDLEEQKRNGTITEDEYRRLRLQVLGAR